MQSTGDGKAISGKGCGLFLYKNFLCVFMHGYAFLCCVMQRKNWRFADRSDFVVLASRRTVGDKYLRVVNASGDNLTGV